MYKSMMLLVFASALLLEAHPVFSQEHWRPLEGLYGGTFNYFVFPAVDQKTVFAGVALPGGATPIYRSRDGGTSWKLMPVSGVMRMDPFNPSNVFAFGRSAWRSTNVGETWEKINEDERVEFFTSDIEFSSIRPGVIYAAHSSWLPPVYEKLGQYVSRSTDSGRTWEKLATIGHISDDQFMQLEVAPESDALFAQLSSGKVVKSIDGGVHWKTVSRGIPIFQRVTGLVHTPWMLALDRERSSILYTAGPKGLFRTSDGGAMWRKVDLGCDDCLPRSVSIDPFDNRTVYVCGVGSLKALKSTDDGETWHPMRLAQNFPGLPYLAIAASPQARSLMFAGVTSRGILRSTNGGTSWALSNHGLREIVVSDLAADPRRPGAFVAIGGTLDGESPRIPLFSFSYGRTWSYNPALGGVNPNEVKIQLSDPDFRVLAGMHPLVAVTTNGGKQWTISRSLHNEHCTEPQLSGKRKVIFCLGGEDPDKPIKRSTNLGNSWTDFGPPLPSSLYDVTMFAVDPRNSDIIYAVVASQDENPPPNTIEKTTDGGRTWTTLKSPEGGEYVVEFHVHPRNPRLFYLSTWGGIFKSTDAGATWTNIAPGLAVNFITLDPDNPNQLFVTRELMWRTKDGGNSWSRLTQDGLPDGWPAARVMVSPWDPRILYGLTIQGLYYLKMD